VAVCRRSRPGGEMELGGRSGHLDAKLAAQE
jgi:hypothetical protein